EVLGLGPLQPPPEDPASSEIMINNPHQIYVERAGRVSLSPSSFESAAQLRQVIDRIVSSVGRRVDESSPMCDARLRDGSRVNVILPPLALDGACMTIRKFSRDKLRPSDLLAAGAVTADMMQFLEAAVRSRLSILVSGGTSSGKTTLLNILSGYIPADERIVTIEDAAELQLRQTHVIRLESRPPHVEAKGATEEAIASGIDVIVQAQRVRGGARKIVSISEVTGLAGGETETQELFQFRAVGVDDDGNVQGFHAATGKRSVHLDHFAERGVNLSEAMFQATGSSPDGLA